MMILTAEPRPSLPDVAASMERREVKNRDGKKREALQAHSSWMEFLTYAAGMSGMQDSLIWPRKRVERTDESERTPKRGRIRKRDIKKGGTANLSQGLNTTRHCGQKDTETLFVEGLSRHGTNKWFSLRLQQSELTVVTIHSPICGWRTCTVRPPAWIHPG